MRTAAIGIGSNSLRMLIADLSGTKLTRVQRYREGLRVFAALDENKNILPEMIEKACASVRAFQQEAIEKGAETVHLFATSAVRDAANQSAFAKALEAATGLELDICSGETEACLSFWGAAGEGKTGLIDIGGGSTEVAVGCGRDVAHAVSLQMGAVRLYRMKPIASVEDAWDVVRMAAAILEPERNAFRQECADEWIGVGGTFTTCAAVVQQIPWQDRTSIHGFVLTRESVAQAMESLAPLSVEERLNLPFLQPQRADIVVHGIAILLACMQELDIPALTVSEYGNLEGYIRAKYVFAKNN